MEKEQLLKWMEAKGFNINTLAEATGDTYSNIHMITNGKRPVNDAFKWRFTVAFGWDEAQGVFLQKEIA